MNSRKIDILIILTLQSLLGVVTQWIPGPQDLWLVASSCHVCRDLENILLPFRLIPKLWWLFHIEVCLHCFGYTWHMPLAPGSGQATAYPAPYYLMTIMLDNYHTMCQDWKPLSSLALFLEIIKKWLIIIKYFFIHYYFSFKNV